MCAIDAQSQPPVESSQPTDEKLSELLNDERRVRRDARDVAILNRVADRLNAEVEDILTYQVVP